MVKTRFTKKHHRTLIEQNEINRLIYQKPLLAILELIRIAFPDEQNTFPEEKDFAKEISNELEIQS